MTRSPFFVRPAGTSWGLIGPCWRWPAEPGLQRCRRFVVDGAVGTDLVVVSKPVLHFSPRIVKAHEPVGILN
jgi:hypothetical protein